jgi:glycerophosphoryl diester phosphodiesterase
MGIATLFAQLRRYWRPLISVHLLFTLLGVAVLSPLFGLLLQGTLALTGSAAVVDQEIARLLLSPFGMLAGVALLAVLLAIAGLEMGALQAIAQASRHGKHLPALAAARYALGHAVPLLRLTLGLTLRVLAYLLPYLAAVALVAWLLLTEHDINYYLAQRPPAFVAAVAVAVVLAVPLLWLLGRRLLGWSLVLPLVLFANTRPEQAFATSETLVAGSRGTCLRALLSWLLLAIALIAGQALFLYLGTALALASAITQLTTLALLLGLLGVIWAILGVLVSAFNLAGFTFIVAALYQQLSPGSSGELVMKELDSPQNRGYNPLHLAVIAGVIAAVGLATPLLILKRIDLNHPVAIIAHRGAAGAAPENTLAAIHRAIADGTDWVEIDVQETRDGQVVVVHDSDFMKLAGDPIKVWEGDLERIRSIDVGSWFDPAFSDQRVPTLEEVLELIREGDSRLVIELKYYGHDEQLEQRVVELVEAADMADRVMVMSLKLQGVQKLKQLRPDWTGGLLAATAVGDITRLEADFLAVNQGIANIAFIRRSHNAGKQVFVWTVNDALSMAHWMSVGVDGVITDEPALARNILAQRADLSPPERLLLSIAMLIGRPEAFKQYRDNSP